MGIEGHAAQTLHQVVLQSRRIRLLATYSDGGACYAFSRLFALVTIHSFSPFFGGVVPIGKLSSYPRKKFGLMLLECIQRESGCLEQAAVAA
jgi:hypothetical protein